MSVQGSLLRTSCTLLQTGFGWAKVGADAGGIWSNLDKTIMSAERSAYGFLFKFGCGAALISIMIAGIMLALAHSPNSANTAKDRLQHAVIGIILFGGLMGIIGTVAGIGSALLPG